MTLNEQAAKCMGWDWYEDLDICCDGSGQRRNPVSCLDDASIVEAETIRRHGWDACRDSLDGITEPVADPNEIDFRSMILATAAQRTEAAARTMENHQ